jgi:hypothetical protein
MTCRPDVYAAQSTALKTSVFAVDLAVGMSGSGGKPTRSRRHARNAEVISGMISGKKGGGKEIFLNSGA